MSPINKLTEHQKEQLAVYRDKWTEIGLSTAPANREAAEKAIIKCYELAGLKAPKKIVWCGSPLSQGLVRAIILDKNLVKEIGDSVMDSVRASVMASVMDSVGESVWASVWDSVRASVMASVMASVGDSVRDSVWESVMASVWESVRASVRESVWASVMDSVMASVGESVMVSVMESVGESVRVSVMESVGDSGYGQHDAHWIGFYEFFRNELNLKEQTEKTSGLIELSKNAGWFLPHENICWISERHCILNRDEQGRLHSLTHPAVAYPDGWSIYAVHGVRVPEYIILRPEEITVEKIDIEENAEIRRVMIDQYGISKYLQDSGSQLIHEDTDQYGRRRKLFRKELNHDEPILMVQVTNSTPEPDGEFKIYFLRVHPECRPLFDDNELGNPQELTCHNAVASTFGKYGHEYNPLIET